MADVVSERFIISVRGAALPQIPLIVKTLHGKRLIHQDPSAGKVINKELSAIFQV